MSTAEYYGIISSMSCACGCGRTPNIGKKYISGHNLKRLKKTQEHRAKIAEAQRRAWATKRQRLPIGSKWKDAYGYIRVKVLPGKGRWKLEHALVMERMIGRPLHKGEIVHHINGIRDDNRESNLFLCRDHWHHRAIEISLVAAFRQLLDAGLARFNAEANIYEAILPG